uniref:Uncharacterized protein n=1 Tax=Avena sativa TaxID=4498 RepID=A0ACD5XJJ7_AVESA
MDQVGGIGGVDEIARRHQQTHDAMGLAEGFDIQLVMLRHDTREKISDYLGRRPMAARWRRRLPDFVRQLEEILFRQYPNKRDYYNMTKEPTESHFLSSLTILGGQYEQLQQNQQLSGQITSSGGYGTTTLTHGITQGATENFRTSYVPYNMGPSFGAGLVPQSANIGTSLSGEAPDEHVNTELSLGMNPTHHSSRVSNNNHVINVVGTSETNRILPMVTPSLPLTVKEVPEEPKFSCPVCLHEMVDASSTLCGHIFCQECIMASIKAQRKCPTCRRKLTMKNFHRVYLPTMH